MWGVNSKWLVIAFFLSGCLSPSAEHAVNWLIVTDEFETLSSVTVNAPYDELRLAVLRADGSIAFDPRNAFASRPSALLKAAVASGIDAPVLRVRTIALDCRQHGMRKALVELSLGWHNRTAKARAEIDATDGNYSAAFTAAFAAALSDARRQLAAERP